MSTTKNPNDFHRFLFPLVKNWIIVQALLVYEFKNKKISGDKVGFHAVSNHLWRFESRGPHCKSLTWLLLMSGKHKSNWLRMATRESTIPHHGHPYLLHSAWPIPYGGGRYTPNRAERSVYTWGHCGMPVECLKTNRREKRSEPSFEQVRQTNGQLTDWPVLTIFVNFHSYIRTCRFLPAVHVAIQDREKWARRWKSGMTFFVILLAIAYVIERF